MTRAFLPLLVIVMSGCIEHEPIALPSAPPKIVIDALISDRPESSYVNIGWSSTVGATCIDIFGNPTKCAPGTYAGPYKVEGIMRITEKNSNNAVEMPFKMDDKEGMILLQPDIIGNVGSDYLLEIQVSYNGNLEFYTAKTKMLRTPEITDISYEIRKGDIGKNDNLVPLISFEEPEGKNFYLFQLCSIYMNTISCGNSRVWSYSLIADTFLPTQVAGLSIDDGASVAKYAEFYPAPEPNSGALVKMYSVDQITYDYYKTLIDQFNNDGGAYSPTPSSPEGNISGDAIGIFRATQESAKSVYF